MSVNINHPEDDISTSSSAPPTLGGQSPLVADNATVAADSSGNVSRWVMSTALGGTVTEDGANTWAKIGAFTPSASSNINLNRVFHILDSEKVNSPIAILHMTLRQSASGLSTTESNLGVIAIGPTTDHIDQSSFKVISSAATNGTAIELWINKKTTFNKFSVYEVGASETSGEWNVSYNNNAAWQSSTPSGAVNLTSDWAGSGQLTSTSFSNGWAGTAYYEKLANGLVKVFVGCTTIGTATDATTIWTAPAGYRIGQIEVVDATGNDATYASAAGRISCETSGTFFKYMGTQELIRCLDSLQFMLQGDDYVL